jgi:hypothetical protein
MVSSRLALDLRLRLRSSFQLLARRSHLVVRRGALSVHALTFDSFNTFDIKFTSPAKLEISNCNTNRRFRERGYTYILKAGVENLGLRVGVCRRNAVVVRVDARPCVARWVPPDWSEALSKRRMGA